MEIILFIIATGALLIIFYIFSQAGQAEKNNLNNRRLFSDAWKRISNEKIKTSHKRRPLQAPDKSTHKNFKSNDPSFLPDKLLRTIYSKHDYYKNVYLKSYAWQRKRFVVMKRDNWRCVHCGRPATQVHHKRYANKIGNEPIEWLESVCDTCHNFIHS